MNLNEPAAGKSDRRSYLQKPKNGMSLHLLQGWKYWIELLVLQETPLGRHQNSDRL